MITLSRLSAVEKLNDLRHQRLVPASKDGGVPKVTIGARIASFYKKKGGLDHQSA